MKPTIVCLFLVASFTITFSKALAQLPISAQPTSVVQTEKIDEPMLILVESFSQGMAVVGFRSGDDYKFGYINRAGNLVIKPQFNGAGKFSDGLAPVGIGNKFGYIDRTGKLVIKPQFDWVERFSEGLAAV